jgi:branched-chain amino acid transport system ATP-binding protein
MGILDVKNCTKRFGGLVAVRDLNMSLTLGALYGLIGPNGAGKTTVFNLITGVYTPDEGSIELEGKTIHKKKPSSIANLGMSRTFQNIRLFKSMTVLENVKLARHMRRKQSLFDAVAHTPSLAAEEKEIETDARELLKIFNLEARASELASSLPYGAQRRLEIVRALATQPKVLLLDEPACGHESTGGSGTHAPDPVCSRSIPTDGAVGRAQHEVVMGICEKIQVIDYGETIALGSPREIQSDSKVIEAYLGGA